AWVRGAGNAITKSVRNSCGNSANRIRRTAVSFRTRSGRTMRYLIWPAISPRDCGGPEFIRLRILAFAPMPTRTGFTAIGGPSIAANGIMAAISMQSSSLNNVLAHGVALLDRKPKYRYPLAADQRTRESPDLGTGV